MKRSRSRSSVAVACLLVGAALTGCVPGPDTPLIAAPPLVAEELELPELRVDAMERRARQLTVRVRSLGCEQLGVGSGFVLPEGLVVTNRHVLEQPLQVTVTTWDGRTMDARVLGVAPDSDLALLRIDPVESLPEAVLRTAPPVADEPVLVVGYPGGGPATLSEGRVVGSVRGDLLGEPADVLRVDAPIRQGNSGGPVLDTHGQVIGIVFAIETGAGTGLAVPVQTLLDRLDVDALELPETC